MFYTAFHSRKTNLLDFNIKIETRLVYHGLIRAFLSLAWWTKL